MSALSPADATYPASHVEPAAASLEGRCRSNAAGDVASAVGVLASFSTAALSLRGFAATAATVPGVAEPADVLRAQLSHCRAC